MAMRLQSIRVSGDQQSDIEHFYRAIADGEPKRELLEMAYDLFGFSCKLRPPVDELRLSRQCGGEAIRRG